MQSSRDSSVLRSLAIAFGDGLAFGVGMKLTQQGRASTALVPASADAPVLDRLEEVERRLQKVEKLPPALVSGALGQPFDAKVLEAVVGALDARLLEQTTQTERRLKDLEAKITIELKTLHAQDHSVATGLQAKMSELHEQFSGVIGDIRKQSEAAHIAYRTELAALHRQFAVETAKTIEAGMSAKDAQFQKRADSLAASFEEHARLTLGRHQALDQAMAAQDFVLTKRIDDLRSGVAAEAARAVDAALASHTSETNQQLGELRKFVDQQLEAINARHLALEGGMAAEKTELARRFEESAGLLETARAGMAADNARMVDERIEQNAAHTVQQISQLRGVFDRHAQLTAERQQTIENGLATHGAELDRRIERLRAGFLEETSRRIDQEIARTASEAHVQLTDLRTAFDEQRRASAVREAEIAAQWESRMAALHSEITAAATHLVQQRVAHAVEEQVTPLRAELDAKNQELTQLRQKLADSDRNAANMILAIGNACREAAERIAPVAPPSPADAPKPEVIEPPAEEPIVASGSDEGLPGFVQPKPPGKLLRIPLVSSMTIAIAIAAALLHYF